MEPIRSDRNQLDPRRRRRSGAAGGGEAGFAGIMRGETEESASAAEPDSGAPVLARPDLPSQVDAPTGELFDAVHSAGQRLLDERSYSAAQAYRDAVRAFLRRLMPEANSVQIHESGLTMVSRKRYFLLTEINRSVDRLLEGLLQTQKKQIDILERLEEVHGMLVDLLH